MSEYTVIYSPPAYGDVISQSECRHDPAGHMMPLGLRIEPLGKKKDRPHGIILDGQFCMKCGWCWHVDTDATSADAPARPGSDDWWGILSIASDEFGDKCWQFSCRLAVLAEEVGHLSRRLGVPQCHCQARARLKIRRWPLSRKRWTDGTPGHRGVCGERVHNRQSLRFTRSSLPYIAHRRGLPRKWRA